MKFYIIVSSTLLLLLIIDAAHGGAGGRNSSAISASKTADKMVYPKKVTSLKKRPTKSPASSTVSSTDSTTSTTPAAKTKKSADVAAAFKDLPADDLEFIKELDKQFKVHGEKIKIKVENDNATDTKNSKRTIDGELGYGYQQNGYEYNRPKFMFYPYSQQDIPSNEGDHYQPQYEKVTSVTIEPSYSYELKPQSYEQPQIDLPQPQSHAEHQHQSQPQQQQYEEPVIVLRIPGPAKYASHLQTLLQQYLEIRATQYLRILEQAEHHNQEPQQHHQPQQQQQHYEQPQIDYQQQSYEQPAQPEVPDYHHEVAYAHQMAPTPQPVSYPAAIDDVYQSYKGRHQQQQHHQQIQAPQQQTEPAYYPEAHAYHAHHAAPQQQEEEPQYYYMPHEQQYAQAPAEEGHSYQHVYLISMSPQQGYGEVHEQEQHEPQQHQQPIYVQEEQNEHSHGHGPTISENNPRTTHTKVIFTHNSEQGGADYSNMYPLPSIRPYERHAPTSMPSYHHQHYQQQEDHQEDYQQQQQQAAPAAHHDTIAITQRPFNYHAHALKSQKRIGRKRGATTVAEADQHLQQIRDYVRDKLGAQTGSAVEFKTTQVIEG